jgi:hypothetical protein
VIVISIEYVLNKIQNAILQAKTQENTSVDVDTLLEYLSKVKDSPEVKLEIDKDLAVYSHERNIEKYKADTQIRVSNYETLSKNVSQQFKAVMELAQSVLKSAILINGGAAVALLAFLGSIWGKGIDSQSIQPMVSGISNFAFGALCGAVSSAFSYCSQSCFAHSSVQVMKILLRNFDKENPEPIPLMKLDIAGYSLQGIAICVAAASYILFVYGTIMTGNAFYQHFK